MLTLSCELVSLILSREWQIRMSAATSAAASAIPSGQSAPVEIINATHHGAWIVIATALGLTLGLVCIFIRLYVRVLITPPLSNDDYIHGAATVHWTLVFLQ